MNNKAFTISLALAALAVMMIHSFITSKEDEIKLKYGSEKPVVVAKRDINALAIIHNEMIEVVTKPNSFVEPGSTRTIDEVKGFIATVPIKKGEQVTLNKITEPGVRTGLARQVSMGKRAVAIPVDDNTAVNRLVKPGDRIDLVATIDPPGAVKGGQLTKLVAQDVPVLAVGEFISNQAPRKVEKDDTTGKDLVRNLNIEKNFNTITIELDPQLAAQLALLRDSGMRVSVLLRNNDDTERVNLQAVSILDILGPDQNKIVRAPSGQK